MVCFNLMLLLGVEDIVVGVVKGVWWWQCGGVQYLVDNWFKIIKYILLFFLFKNLFEQFYCVVNVYFVFIVMFNFVLVVNVFQFGLMLVFVLFILVVMVFKDLWEDYSCYRLDYEINYLGCFVFSR